MADVLNFDKTNFLGYIDTRWTLKDCVLTSDNLLQIMPNGSALLTLIEEVQDQFAYINLKVMFSGDSISPENNYKSKPTIYLREAYKDLQTNEINKSVFRGLGFNTFIEEDDIYTDSTTFKTENRPMAQFQLEIKNETEDTLYIHSIEAFKSVDIPESQLSKFTQKLYKEGSAELFKVYHNDDSVYSMNGLGVFTQNNLAEIKFMLNLYDGQLISVKTNAGQTVSVQHIIEQINLEEA